MNIGLIINIIIWSIVIIQQIIIYKIDKDIQKTEIIISEPKLGSMIS